MYVVVLIVRPKTEKEWGLDRRGGREEERPCLVTVCEILLVFVTAEPG